MFENQTAAFDLRYTRRVYRCETTRVELKQDMLVMELDFLDTL